MKMKRFFALMLALALSLTMLQGVVFGSNTPNTKDFEFTAVSNGVTITYKVLTPANGGTHGTVQVGSENTLYGNSYAQAIDESTPGALDIPATVTHTDGGTTYTYTVTSIGVSAFWYCDDLTSVTLPTDLKTIGVGAFQACNILTSIDIPEGVTSIGQGAFQGCEVLAAVNLGGATSLQTIGSAAFQNCFALKSITFPDSVTTIGSHAFRSSGIETITFEGSNIGEWDATKSTGLHLNVFDYATKLTTITLAGAYDPIMIQAVKDALAQAGRSGVTLNHAPAPTPPPVTTTTPTALYAFYPGDGTPYTQIVDTADTTAMLQQGSTITVIGQSPTGVIVKLDPTALSGKQSLSINSSIADMQLTAEQIASLIQQADGNTIHITIKQTADGSTISILAGGRTITL